MSKKTRIPITRLNKFFDENDFNYQIEMGREYCEDVLDFRVFLLKVNRVKTQIDNIYGETPVNNLNFQDPIEIKVMDFLLENGEQKSYNNNEGSVIYVDYGNLSFNVYVKHLEELETDIQMGDIIGYVDFEDNIKYFVVTNDGRIYSENSHTLFGYKGFFRTINCTVIDPAEFNGI